MIRPRRSRSIPLAARFVSRKVPVRLVSMTEAQSSSDIRSSRVSAVMPAFATSASTGPCAASISANAASTADASVTSQVRASAPSGPPPERDVTATLSPSARNARAIARPMPRLPPVTSTERGSGLAGVVSVAAASVTPPTLVTTGEYGQTPCRQGRSVVLEPKPDLQSDLEVLDVAVLDLSAHLGHLEPVDVAQRRAGPPDGVADGLLDPVRGRADELGDAVGAVAHVWAL